jgi:pimeloyl-ACP methyl ester carboxylesterase
MKYPDHRFVSKSDSNLLVFVLHGYADSATQMDDVCSRVIERELPNADILIPAMPYAFFASTRPLTEAVIHLAQMLDTYWKKRIADQGKCYDSVMLVGYSMGSITVRALFAHGWGYNSLAQSKGVGPKEEPRPWAKAVTRVVLLAGVNRGWSADSPVSLSQRILFALGNPLLAVWPFGRPCVLDIRRGAPFLTAMRLDWLRLKANFPADINFPPVIQLLGTQDDIVNPNDNLDFFTGHDFFYIEVPGSGHFDILDLTPGRTFLSGRDIGEARREAIALAVTGSADALKRRSQSPEFLTEDSHFREVDQTINHAIFIVHGIRDRGFWTKKIGREIRLLADKRKERVKIVNPSYGYFPIGQFILRWSRLEKVEWLMDKYVEVKRLYPNAIISFIGHSNGTYLLANALERYPFVTFHRVVFAGSMVRRNFPWAKFIGNQVQRAFNIVASRDTVLAGVPLLLQPIHFFDIGTAGLTGFKSKTVRDLRFVHGDHDAGIGEDMWADLARLVLEENVDLPDPHFKRRSFFEWLRCKIEAPWVAIIATFVVAIGLALTADLIRPSLLPSWLAGLLGSGDRAWVELIVYALLIRAFLEKV